MLVLAVWTGILTKYSECYIDMWYAVHSVQCVVWSADACAVAECSVQCAMCSLQFAVWYVQFAVCSVMPVTGKGGMKTFSQKSSSLNSLNKRWFLAKNYFFLLSSSITVHPRTFIAGEAAWSWIQLTCDSWQVKGDNILGKMIVLGDQCINLSIVNCIQSPIPISFKEMCLEQLECFSVSSSTTAFGS